MRIGRIALPSRTALVVGTLRLLHRLPARVVRVTQALVDATALVAALAAATVLEHDLRLGAVDAAGLLGLAPLAALASGLVGLRMGLYSGRWRYGSFEEVAVLPPAVGLATAALLALDLAAGRPVPPTAAAAAGVLGLLLMAGARYCARLLRLHARRPSPERARRVVVFGAGDGGVQAVTAMLGDPGSPYVPVALLDDDPDKARLRIVDVPVLGTRHDLAETVRRTGADTLLVAIPSADATLVRALLELALPTGVDVRVLPPVAQLFGSVTTEDMRPVTVSDLLGRREVTVDLAEAAGYLQGRRVLVTGAGGSIGSELCRQVARFAPRELVLLDRDESGLHGVQLSMTRQALLSDGNLVVADIRDRARVLEVFARYRPEVVFHAAALKHLPLLEMHPSEAVKTNVTGTLHLLEAAALHGVDRFVNVSTDKAADPTSVLGCSKRITERLTAAFATQARGSFLSVRFGNVLGSRGSVLTTFQEQIRAGGPVTVTHPEVTRYFMTVEEAVQLVVQAGAIGCSGEALILDMGAPVRIADVARQLVETAQAPVRIVYTGLRPGEKLHEQLLAAGEPDERPRHPLVSHVRVPPLDRSVLALLDTHLTDERVVQMLRWLVDAPTFTAADRRPAAPPLPPATPAGGPLPGDRVLSLPRHSPQAHR